MSELRQRQPRHVDSRHLQFVRAQPCCLPYCKRQAEAAHIRFACAAIGKPATGLQEKPADSFTVPLCPYHHRIGVDSQHANNEAAWWARTGLNPFEIAARLWIESGGADRALQPKPAPRPRKIKARKPPEQRVKIRAGRALQSRGFPTKKDRETAAPARTGLSSC